jgi:DNA helicase HerA-like ATPase
VREIRSFGQGLVFISQHPSLMPIFVLGNCNTLIMLGLSHESDMGYANIAAMAALTRP